MSSRKAPVAASVLWIVASWSVSQALGATLSKVEWQSGSPENTDSLVLTFSSGVPEMEIEPEPWGLGVWFPGTSLDAVGTEGVRVVGESGGSRMRVERPGATLRSVRVGPDSIRFLLTRGVAGAPSSPAYRIGVGDVITVSVYKNADLSGDFTVAPDGTLNIPLVGSLPAQGLTDAELVAELRRILEKDYLVDPQVSVTLKTYQSQWVYIAGSVPRASRTALSPGMTLKDVLSEAGVALGPLQEIVLTRAAGGGEIVTLGSEALEADTCPLPRDGDVLTVQEPSYVFLQGEVRRPGRFPMIPAMTILQAVTMAEGFTEWASKKDVRILRSDGKGTVEEVVNLKKVEERRAPDVLLRPGDVVLVRRKIL